MKINVISDLHLDFADLTLPGGDVLIISGDLCEAKSIRKAEYNPNMVLLEHERADHRPDRFYRFLEEECGRKYRETIMVMGNHEHYGFKYHKTYDHIRSQLPDNVHLLENETYELDGVTFMGATLWTDMNRGDEITLWQMKSMMNDYRQITAKTNGNYFRLQPERTMADHHQTMAYFKKTLTERREAGLTNPVVVVTHHSPSKASTHPRYVNETIMNGAYSSDLSEFILDHPEIQLWTHGHTHSKFDYTIGECRIVCNPRGYKGYEERAEEFNPQEFEITL